MPKTTQKPSVSDVLAELRKKDKSLQVGVPQEEERVEGLSTGNIALDAITDIGGFPKGRITELIGPPSSGKTTSALQAAARCQAAGGIIIFEDFEHALDAEYCAALGLDVFADSFIYIQPEHFEQGANAARKLIATGDIAMLITDSVATMVTKHELEAETGQVEVADRAKMMHQYLRQLNPLLARTKTSAIFLNHLMVKVDTTPMGRKLAAQGVKQETSPGGTALPFYSSLRIKFKQIGNLRTEEMSLLANESVSQVRQTKVEAIAVKNKVGDPFRVAELRVRYGKGFSQAFNVLGVLTAYKAVKTKSGGIYEFPPELGPELEAFKVKGEDNCLSAIEQDPAWLERLEKTAQGILEEHAGAVVEYVDGAEYDDNGEPASDVDVDSVLSNDGD